MGNQFWLDSLLCKWRYRLRILLQLPCLVGAEARPPAAGFRHRMCMWQTQRSQSQQTNR